MKIRNIVSAAAACAVAAAALVIPTSAEESYVAGITWQSSSYYFRNTIAQSELLYWDNDLGEAAPLEGATFTDANITGDGEYPPSSLNNLIVYFSAFYALYQAAVRALL